MSVGRICNREVDLADLDESVQVAAVRMNSRNVGTLVVVDAQSRVIGILTDRDLALNVVGKGRDPATTTVGEVMTKCPDSVQEETAIEAAISRMRAGPYRRLPVIDRDRKLVGLISLDDILDLLSEEFQEIGRLVRQEGPAALETVE
jgi:CBS domain-containing protein